MTEAKTVTILFADRREFLPKGFEELRLYEVNWRAGSETVLGMPTVHANGIDIWYERLGPAEGTPLVITHGVFAGPSAH